MATSETASQRATSRPAWPRTWARTCSPWRPWPQSRSPRLGAPPGERQARPADRRGCLGTQRPTADADYPDDAIRAARRGGGRDGSGSCGGFLTKTAGGCRAGRRGWRPAMVVATAADPELRRARRSRATGRSARPTSSAPPRRAPHAARTGRAPRSAPGWSTAWAASSSATSTPGRGYRFEETGGEHARDGVVRRAVDAARRPRRRSTRANTSTPGSTTCGCATGSPSPPRCASRRARPWPTAPSRRSIEYSGYATAAPHSLIDALEGKAPSSDPLLPDTSTVVGSVIAPLLGFRHRQRPDAGHGVLGRCLRPLRAAL